MNSLKGFTLIELITVITVIVIISASGAYLMVYLVQNSVFIPNKLNMDMAASEALNIMIEGDDAAKGLRFSKSITGIQSNQLRFNNQDAQDIVLRLDTAAKKLYRSIAGSPEALVPYYATTGVNIAAKDNKLFTYYDQSDNEIDAGTGNSADVRRVEINLLAETGSGSYNDWQGRSILSSSITVRKLE
jgi:prepilin-type N-terminal cleavage/methylation domain-containing protein